MWRYIKDEKYGGYSIQKLNKFLWFKWWSNEYLSGCESEVKRLIELKSTAPSLH